MVPPFQFHAKGETEEPVLNHNDWGIKIKSHRLCNPGKEIHIGFANFITSIVLPLGSRAAQQPHGTASFSAQQLQLPWHC